MNRSPVRVRLSAHVRRKSITPVKEVMLSSYIPTGGDSIAQQESRGEVVAVAPTVETPSVGAEGDGITARSGYDRVEGAAEGLSTSLDIA